MKLEATLKALYMFTSEQYDNLKKDYNKLPKHEKARLPFTLFIISVFSTLLEEAKSETNDKHTKKEKVD